MERETSKVVKSNEYCVSNFMRTPKYFQFFSTLLKQTNPEKIHLQYFTLNFLLNLAFTFLTSVETSLFSVPWYNLVHLEKSHMLLCLTHSTNIY